VARVCDMEEERAQPAGLDLSLDELINAGKHSGGRRGGGRGGGRGRGGRGGRGGGFRQQRGYDDEGSGPIRRYPVQMRAPQQMPPIQYAMPRFQPPMPQYFAQPPLPQGPPPGPQFGRGSGGFGSSGSRDRPQQQTSKQYKQARATLRPPS
jgi:hypothetical protein